MMKFNHFSSVLISMSLLMAAGVSLFLSLHFLFTAELVLEWEAIFINSWKIPMLVVLDWMSLFFLSTVSLISAGVLFYSSSYMSKEVFFSRFIFLVFSFVLSMWILILSPNFISILLGWDGLGVTSYLLVIFYQSEKSFNAGMITALTNRLGDVGLLVIIGLLLSCGDWSYLYYSLLGEYFSNALLILLILTASTKSAQIPFSAWLPAAMAAPTPVSSLVHSSTLVTAGVYLLIRMNFLLASFNLLWILCGLGAMTMMMAGISALGELDMKKIIALSTLSQLGLMFMTIGLGLPLLAFFHLISHAYFKAMLFMCAGSVIHSMKDYQDTRLMGNGLKSLPVAFSIFTVANLSLCGIPFMSGFYSKDLILEVLMMSNGNIVIFLIALISTLLTLMYSIRVTQEIFFNSPKSEAMLSQVEMDVVMLSGMMVLLIPSIVGGLGISWSTLSFLNIVFLPSWLKLSILGLIFISMISLIKPIVKFLIPAFFHFMWFMPFIFSWAATQSGMKKSKQIWLYGESGWIFLGGVKIFSGLSRYCSNYVLSLSLSNFLKSLMFFLMFIIVNI